MPSQEARERKKLKKEATKLDKEVKTVASSYKAEFAAREKSRMKEQSAARKEVSLLQKALSYKGERKPRVEIPADAAGWKIEQLKEQQKAVNKANKKIELREEAKALGSRYLKVQALRYKTGAKIMEVTAPARQNIGMSNRVIGKKIAAWGMQKVQNKPVLKKDVGAIDISYTAKGFED